MINNTLPYQEKSITLKKQLMIYWEIVEKKNLDGSMKDEFMMVCNNFRNDLMHANEFIVGRALRLIGRINLK